MCNATIDEMVLWARVVISAGYPAALIAEYLMGEFGLRFGDAEELALWACSGAVTHSWAG